MLCKLKFTPEEILSQVLPPLPVFSIVPKRPTAKPVFSLKKYKSFKSLELFSEFISVQFMPPSVVFKMVSSFPAINPKFVFTKNTLLKPALLFNPAGFK